VVSSALVVVKKRLFEKRLNLQDSFVKSSSTVGALTIPTGSFEIKHSEPRQGESGANPTLSKLCGGN